MTSHDGRGKCAERSLDEDILDSLEVALTRIDSSDEEPLVAHHGEETCCAE